MANITPYQVHINNLIGQKFVKWTVISDAGSNKYKYRQSFCKCECGNEQAVKNCSLLNGSSKSCISCRSKRHGLAHHPLYCVWEGMIDRCTNPKATGYEHYGGRGIKVCERWKKFINFYNDVNIGYARGLKLDRVDNDGNYEPSNFKWSTQKEQLDNRRNSIRLTINGITASPEQWANISGTPRQTIHTRYFRGYSHEECVYGKNKSILN